MKMPIVISLRMNEILSKAQKREKKRTEKTSEEQNFFCSFSFFPSFWPAEAKITKPLTDFGINVTENNFILFL